MAKSVATIGVSVTARTSQFVKKLRKAGKSLRRFSAIVKRVTKTLKKLSLAFVGFAGTALFALAKILRHGEMFNRKMRRSLAIMGGVSQELRREMTKTAIAVAKVTVASAEQAAESYFFLASAGLNAKQSIAALPVVANFAQSGMFDMARATDLLTDAQSALGLTVTDTHANMMNMRRVADVLVKANTLANASVEQFSESLTTKAGAALKVLNKDIEEGVAVLAAFADQGIKSSDAGTALNIVLRDLSTKAIKNAKAFEEFNVRVFDAQGNMRNVASILRDIDDSFRGSSDEVKKAALLQLGFSDKSVIFLQTLLGLSGAIQQYEASLRNAGGTMELVARKQLTPFERAWNRITGTVAELAIKLQPAVTAFALTLERVNLSLETAVGKLTSAKVLRGIAALMDMVQRAFARVRLEVLRLAESIVESVVNVIASLEGTTVGKKMGLFLPQSLVDTYTKLQVRVLNARRALRLLSDTPQERKRLGIRTAGERFREFADIARRQEQHEMFLDQMENAWSKATHTWENIIDNVVVMWDRAAKGLKARGLTTVEQLSPPSPSKNKSDGQLAQMAQAISLRALVPGLSRPGKPQETFDRKVWAATIQNVQLLKDISRKGFLTVLGP